jgi:hypothetical protein
MRESHSLAPAFGGDERFAGQNPLIEETPNKVPYNKRWCLFD